MKKILAMVCLSLCITSCEQGVNKASPNLEARKAALKNIVENRKKQGDFQVAAELESQLVQLDTTNTNSIISLSRSLRKIGNNDEAAQLLIDGIQLNPEAEDLIIEQARTYVENEDAQEGIDKLDSVKKLKNRDYYNSYGVAYDMLDKHDKAQEYLSQGRLAFPSDNLIKNNLGLSYALDGKYAEAEKIFTELIHKAEAKKRSFHNLAMVYALTNREPQAKAILRKDMSEKFADETIQFYKEFVKAKSPVNTDKPLAAKPQTIKPVIPIIPVTPTVKPVEKVVEKPATAEPTKPEKTILEKLFENNPTEIKPVVPKYSKSNINQKN
jgi:Flp pilus assembly protein TadD